MVDKLSTHDFMYTAHSGATVAVWLLAMELRTVLRWGLNQSTAETWVLGALH